MNKQEFLAASLPYGLKVITNYSSDVYNVNGCTYDDGLWLETHEDGDKLFDYDEIKPIIHPLFDLNKEIEHNGEKFVPIERLVDLIVNTDFYDHEYIVDRVKLFDELQKDIQYVPFYLVQKLIEWHFDIAGLIEKGEAIDVNSLSENPYE